MRRMMTAAALGALAATSAHAEIINLVCNGTAIWEIMERTKPQIESKQIPVKDYRMRGDLLIAKGDALAAEQNYRLALSVSHQQSAKTFELRAATSLARLWRDQGKRKQAPDLLTPIYSWFTEGFDTPVLQDVKALLDQLGR